MVKEVILQFQDKRKLALSHKKLNIFKPFIQTFGEFSRKDLYICEQFNKSKVVERCLYSYRQRYSSSQWSKCCGLTRRSRVNPQQILTADNYRSKKAVHSTTCT